MKKLQLHVGSLGDMGKRFVDAWHRAERTDRTDDETGEAHITFLDLESMQAALSSRRLAMRWRSMFTICAASSHET